MSKLFVLYDGRAKSGDTDNATVMDTATSEEEARREGTTTWKDYDAIWAEYDVKDGSNEIINEVLRYDLPPVEEPV